jgi:hypothetical protein
MSGTINTALRHQSAWAPIRRLKEADVCPETAGLCLCNAPDAHAASAKVLSAPA